MNNRERHPWFVLRAATVEDLDACCDLCDTQLRGDAYVPKGQMKAILSRATSQVWLVLVDQQLGGFAVTYRESTLHNIVLAPWARAKGIGKLVLAELDVKRIRSKSNMKAGDPQAFYEANGFELNGHDAKRPHIKLMERATATENDERVCTDEESDMLVKRLFSIVFGRTVHTETRTREAREEPAEEIQGAKADGHREECDCAQEIARQEEDGMVTIPRHELDVLKSDAQKYRDYAKRQRGYQSKRYAKKRKMNANSSEQSAPTMFVKTD